ncbi:MAG: trypsin-like peptidase domain-containing protein [Oscillospiraceae bacterium]|nr:trypsin-like peptidase domain-containing protein [Oscillospiraceae bacterium]
MDNLDNEKVITEEAVSETAVEQVESEKTLKTVEELLAEIDSLKARLEKAEEDKKSNDAEALEDIKALAAMEADAYDYLPRPVGKVKKRDHSFLKAFTLMLIVFIALFFITARFVFGKGWITNLINGEPEGMNFTLPIAELPELEDQFYQADGRYTTEGVAKAVSPSIVTVEAFIEGYAFAPYGQGSGIIMSDDGYVITNAHVIDGATLGVKVRLHNGNEYDALVIGSDYKSDIAVLKINSTEKLFAAQFGDSDALVLGEQVVAIGTPAGLEQTVTSGCVSGLDRMIKVNDDNINMSCIQIDAAINPGNSGGALINMWGQVIGITSSKLDSVDYDNIGFAIEMSAAKPIIENLIEHGRVLGRPKIGISFYQFDEATADYYGTIPGLHIAEIDQSCDIANTQLAVDDIITHMNGTPVMSSDDVYAIILDLQPGDTVTANVSRIKEDGSYETFEIEFKLMEDDSSFVKAEEEPEVEQGAE